MSPPPLLLSWARLIQSLLNPTSWCSMLILPSYLQICLPGCFILSVFLTKTLYAPFLSSIHSTYPAHASLLYLITRIILMRGNPWLECDKHFLLQMDEELAVISFWNSSRNIFGPVSIDNIWRIRNNLEFDELIEDANIARFIKAQRIK